MIKTYISTFSSSTSSISSLSDLSLAKITVDININIAPIISANVSCSLNIIIPITILTIGSKVPRIDADDTPINFIPFNNSTIESIVEITAIQTYDIVRFIV